MFYSNPADAGIDADALQTLAGIYGERATKLPPIAMVIAAYNEEGAVGPVVEKLPKTVCGLAAEVIVVADGCVDATAKEADAAGAVVCDVPVNRGQGAALRLGYRIAREGGAQYIATLDGDGQWDPADLPAMVALLEADEADFVLGSRQLGQTENTEALLRNTGVRFFALVISRLTRRHLTDTSSGLRLMRASLTGTVTQTQPQYQTSELLIGALLQGYRVAEVPTVMRRRISGTSKKGHNVLYGLRYASVIAHTYRRERRAARAR